MHPNNTMETNKTEVNSTSNYTSTSLPDFEMSSTLRAALIIEEYFIPIICVFCILGIIHTITVLSRKNMCTSTNCHLISMATADLFLLLLYSVSLIEKYVPGRHNTYFMLYQQCFGSVLMQIFYWHPSG